MAEHFVIAYKGQLAEGKTLELVKQGVAQLFKVDVTKVEHLFSGQWVSIKKGVDEATAKKYQGALAKMGAICRVVTESQFAELKLVPAIPESTTEPKPVTQPTDSGALTTEPATAAEKRELESRIESSSSSATESMPLHSVVKEAPAGLGELENISVDASWDHLEEPDNTPPPQVNLNGVSLAEVGAELVEHKDTPDLQVDTSELSLDVLGAELVEHEEIPELEVDTSTMVLDEPGVIIVEHKPVEEPEIDISKISLE